MTYKLAKQLKDAGFPFQDSYAADLDMWGEKFSIKIDGTIYLIPILSELIEACGSEFSRLSRFSITKLGTNEVVRYRWEAETYPEIEPEIKESIWADGKTSEEAVAKLYIKLNK